MPSDVVFLFAAPVVFFIGVLLFLSEGTRGTAACGIVLILSAPISLGWAMRGLLGP